MFKSEKLVRITIQVPEPFISAATGILARFKLLHLIRIDETPLGRLGYGAETDGTLMDEFEALFHGVETLLHSLEIRPEGIMLEGEVIPEKDVFKVRELLGDMRNEVESALGDLEGLEKTLREKRAFLDRLLLLPGELDFSRLLDVEFLSWEIGLLPSQGFERLEESLSHVHYALMELGTVQERSLILSFVLLKDGQVLEQALRGALLEAIEIPDDTSGTVETILTDLRSEISALERKALNLREQRELLQKRFKKELLVLRERIVVARQILSARRFFGKIDKSYLISGWVPERLFEAVGEELRNVTEGQLVFEKVDPEDLREVRKGIVKIPILFNNPMLISPFEKLTSLYGTPRYEEVEPTIFFALSFLLLFGMMFGDVGQGGLLFAAGYLLFRRSYKHMDYGIILMECGVSSMLFGFLYGSIFGLETVIPALWFRPIENIPYFIELTFKLGVCLVSLGLMINLVNALILRETEKLFSGSGLAGALLYWMVAGLAMKYLVTGAVASGELTLLAWAATALMAVIILQRPLHRLIVKREPLGRIVRQSGFLTELVESTVELFDDLMRFVSNTVSFIRVAAFALSHAALFIAVFSIASLISHEKGGGISYWLVVAIGNVVVIFLEGMVVAIQTIRLEYYEFFGKFFRGGGEKFRSFDREIGSPEERKP